jgi:hypothetical protein
MLPSCYRYKDKFRWSFLKRLGNFIRDVSESTKFPFLANFGTTTTTFLEAPSLLEVIRGHEAFGWIKHVTTEGPDIANLITVQQKTESGTRIHTYTFTCIIFICNKTHSKFNKTH